MRKRSTSTEFISKSIQLHGPRYDYTDVIYVNNHTKVKIKCKTHGIFLQTPNCHLSGSGCPCCAPNKKMTTETFVSRSLKLHGDKYDYSNVKYTNNYTKVKIKCKIHGIFLQIPNDHLMKCGCPACGSVYKPSTTEYIYKVNIVHNNLYDYSRVVYSGAHKKITIICKNHGEFLQRASDHLNGFGCPKCSGKNKKTTEEFIKISSEIHHNKYDYSSTIYDNSQTPIAIICPIHDKFFQKPYTHQSGSGCPLCSIDNKTLTTSEFIERAVAIHGDRYAYNLTNYTGRKFNITIICKTHGEFIQQANCHLIGAGCPRCNQTGYSQASIKWIEDIMAVNNIYIQHALNTGEYRIPNTKYKVDGYCEETNTIYEFHGDCFHGNPTKYNETDKCNPFSDLNAGELYQQTINRELHIKELGYNLVVMWETDYKRINQK